MPNSPSAAVSCSTASTIAAGMETGTHELIVSGYSSTKGLGVGKAMSSTAFTIGGQCWRILYYPNGYTKECADWISIYLKLEGKNTNKGNDEVRARLKLSLLDQVGEAVLSFSFPSRKICSFNGRNQWGYRKFMKREDIESSPYLMDRTFRVSCHVAVFKIRAEETPVHFPAAAPSANLHRNLGDLLEKKVGADVKFRVGKETFWAHRCILAARSRVFKAELFGWMKEIKVAHVRINDMDPRVFWAMLHFIYTDTLPEVDEDDRTMMVQHLLAAADRYCLERLKIICEDILCNFIDTDTAATILELAQQHGCSSLKERCFNFLKNPGNTIAVMATDGFEHLMNSCPSLIKDLLAEVAP